MTFLRAYGTSEGVTKGNLKRGANPNGPESKPGSLATSFALNSEGRYVWSGPVNPANSTVKVSRGKWAKLALHAAQWGAARLFATGQPINIEVMWDNALQTGTGSSSTSADGTRAQVYVNTHKANTAHDIIQTVIHELVHSWQRRNGWGKPDVSVAWHMRPEEKHALKAGSLLANEFELQHGRAYGAEPSQFYNTPKYFDTEGL